MENYRHAVAGIYPSHEAACRALDQLVARGLPRDEIQLLTPGQAGAMAGEDQHAGSRQVLKDVIVDSTVGTAIGAGVFGLGHMALVAANISLFVASPIIGPLAMLGWGASVGGVLGAAVGLSGDRREREADRDQAQSERKFGELVADATRSGYFMVVAHATTEDETRLACEVIGASVDKPGDMATDVPVT